LLKQLLLQLVLLLGLSVDAEVTDQATAAKMQRRSVGSLILTALVALQ
jgi:hypothetical protein